jgi:CDGSH-type Zn-finger protein
MEDAMSNEGDHSATSEARVAGREPMSAEVEAGKAYFWCACGRSAKQPFCDGSHKGTRFTPLKLEPDAARKVFLCCCKQTRNPPFCDGSHKTLT